MNDLEEQVRREVKEAARNAAIYERSLVGTRPSHGHWLLRKAKKCASQFSDEDDRKIAILEYMLAYTRTKIVVEDV